jgi:hypothetical protein
MKRKGNYKFAIGEIVRYDGDKAKVINRWWDGVGNNMYEIKFMIGRSLARDSWGTKENKLEAYK